MKNYCEKCYKKVGRKLKFCPYCGSPMYSTSQVIDSETGDFVDISHNQEYCIISKKRNIIAVIIIFGLFALSLFLSFFVFSIDNIAEKPLYDLSTQDIVYSSNDKSPIVEESNYLEPGVDINYDDLINAGKSVKKVVTIKKSVLSIYYIAYDDQNNFYFLNDKRGDKTFFIKEGDVVLFYGKTSNSQQVDMDGSNIVIPTIDANKLEFQEKLFDIN